MYLNLPTDNCQHRKEIEFPLINEILKNHSGLDWIIKVEHITREPVSMGHGCMEYQTAVKFKYPFINFYPKKPKYLLKPYNVPKDDWIECSLNSYSYYKNAMKPLTFEEEVVKRKEFTKEYEENLKEWEEKELSKLELHNQSFQSSKLGWTNSRVLQMVEIEIEFLCEDELNQNIICILEGMQVEETPLF